jgi:protocatechuate 3,4-dioxygenase beta subunit
MRMISCVAVVLIEAALMRPMLAQERTGQNASGTPRQEAHWTVEGTVTDASSGAPIRAAAIRTDGPSRVQIVSSDEAGHFVLRGVKPGSYRVYPRKRGYGGIGPSARPRQLTLFPGSEIKRIDFQLRREAIVSGRVLDANREPLRAAEVMLIAKRYRRGKVRLENLEQVETNDLGEYRIPDIREGQYYLHAVLSALQLQKRAATSELKTARKPGLGPALTTFYPNARTLDSAVRIPLRAGEQREAVDIVFARAETYCVRGLVMAEGAAVIAVVLQGTQDYCRFRLAAGSIASGEQFEVCGLPPGRYELVSTSWNDTNPAVMKPIGLLREEFDIATRDVDLGTRQAQPPMLLSGKVSVAGAGADDDLPAGIAVMLDLMDRPYYARENLQGPVKPSGEFLISCLPDDYGLRMLGLPDGYYAKSVTQQGRDVSQGGIRPGAGELQIALGPDAAAITGNTVNRDNQLMKDVSIILIPKDESPGSGIVTKQSDQNGEFHFASLPPGVYRLLAFTELLDGEERDPNFLSLHTAKALEVELLSKGNRSVTLTTEVAH